ncbi:hypothetical protein [Streptomyces cinereoruber]|uniref:hypothetical protein n=1 Tax=Streptomyces cinereoruber TaxID=67260 RepID=UPI00363B5292
MKPVASVLVAAALWGTVGPAQIWADTGAHPVSLGAAGAALLLGGLFTVSVPERRRASTEP